MELNVLSVARRPAAIYQMCLSLATAPLGTPREASPPPTPPRAPLGALVARCRQSPVLFTVRGGGRICLFLGNPGSHSNAIKRQKEEIPQGKRRLLLGCRLALLPRSPLPWVVGTNLGPEYSFIDITGAGCSGCWRLHSVFPLLS